MKKIAQVLGIALLLCWLAFIYHDAWQCSNSGGAPVPSIGYFECVVRK